MYQPTGQLPIWRTTEYKPWECIGLDYFGPIILNNKKKFYGLIITCSVSRAIDIEIVQINQIFNRNFRAEKEFKLLIEANKRAFDTEPIWTFEWHFIPSHTPGMYERMITEIKRSLPNMKECKNYYELRCIISEIISVINSRPLMENDDTILTPAHYII